jgi:hypothetical protein
MTTTSAVFAWFPDGEVRRLSPPAGFYTEPAVHPDGERAAFWGGAFGTPGVWQVDIASGRIARLTTMASGSWRPSYSLSGDRMAHASDRFTQTRTDDMAVVAGRLLMERRGDRESAFPDELNSHIFLSALDGRDLVQVTSGEVRDDHPALNPDGSRVAFTSDRGGASALWVAATEAEATPEPLVDAPSSAPCWSADGERVYFESGGRAMWVGAGGGTPHAIEWDEPVDPASLHVDPDGEHLLAHSAGSDGETIWELALDGGEARELRPPGFYSALHPSRARNGVIVFASIVEM